ncbi:AhpD-like protein [Xylariaceae sp. FL0594]|nr:AhpD-like protein [Xylariaceae sp. FL0594]
MRLPYISDPPPTTTSEDSAIVSRIRARRAPRPLQALDLTLLHSPPVADGWNAFLGAVRTRTTLPASLREVAICRVAVCNEAWYEWAHHAPLARNEGGLSENAIEILKKSREELERIYHAAGEKEGVKEDTGLGEREWAVLLYADEMTRNVKVSDRTFDLLRSVCSEREVVEVTATVAAYNCVSRFLVALDVGERNGTGPIDVPH